MGSVKQYAYNMAIATDQWFGTLFGLAPDKTISTQAYEHRDHWAGAASVKFIDFLFSWYEKDHCKSSAESGDRHEEDVWGKL